MSRWAGPSRILGRHRAFVAVLVVGMALRLVTDLTRVPAVYQDSVVYLRLAEHAPWAPFSPTRPSGYPVALRLLGSLADGLDVVTAAQHLAGLAVAILLYANLARVGVRLGLAAGLAAVVVLDSHTLALEQSVLAETLFSLTVLASLALVVRSQQPATVAKSGLLLAYAVTLRTVGLAAVPVWLGWLLWSRVSRRALLAGAAAVVLPLVGYASLHAADGRGFHLVDGDGWYLYSKVGPIVDCEGASVPEETRPLCVEPVSDDPTYYLYNPASPAYRLFLGGQPVDLEVGITHENNRLLREFSRAIILANPVDFAGVVAHDTLRYFLPADPPVELSLYGAPGTPMAQYERWLHVRWWMVAGALLGGVAAVATPLYRRPSGLFLGAALAVVLGTAATAAFNLRYLVPLVPLFLAAAGPALDRPFDRLTALLAHRRRAGH